MKFDKYTREQLLPSHVEELIVNFNSLNKVYVEVPLKTLLRHKDELIKHATRQKANLSGWHSVVKNPHAFAHIKNEKGEIVLEVPPILARIPTINPGDPNQTLSAAVERFDRDIDRLPIAADKQLRRALENAPVVEYTDEYIQLAWLKFLRAFGVDVRMPDEKPTNTEVQSGEEEEDIFGFD